MSVFSHIGPFCKFLYSYIGLFQHDFLFFVNVPSARASLLNLNLQS